MSDGNIDLAATGTDQPGSQRESAEGVHPESDDRLLTQRLPPITPPPLRPSQPPSDPPGISGASLRSPQPPSFVSTSPGMRASWWREIMTATFPPEPRAPLDDRTLERRIGATCAGMALGFVIVALVLALHGPDMTSNPTLGAAMILSRAAIALGFLAFGLGLLKMGERFFVGRDAGASARRPGGEPLH